MSYDKTLFDETLDDITRGLRRRDIRHGAPHELEKAILAALPGPAAPPKASGFSLSAGLICGLAAISGTAGVLGIRFLSHRLGHQKPDVRASATAESDSAAVSREIDKILAAVDRQNAWHLSETSYDSKGHPLTYPNAVWEEWESRSPFFYRRDNSGGETIIDDGNTVIHVVPPQKITVGKGGSKKCSFVPGRIFIRSSPGPRYVSWDVSGILTGSAGKSVPGRSFAIPFSRLNLSANDRISERIIPSASLGSNAGKILTMDKAIRYRERTFSPQGEVMRIVTNMQRLVVSATTHLPQRYVAGFYTRRADEADDRNQALASPREVLASYYAALPPNVTKMAPHPGYSLINLTALSPPGTDKVTSAANSARLSLRAEPVTRDASGIYVVRLKVDLGLRSDLQRSVPFRLDNFTAQEDAGHVDVCVTVETGDPLVPMLLIAPADPDRVPISNPVRMTIRCDAILGGSDGDSSLGGFDTKMPMTITVPVPGKRSPTGVMPSLLPKDATWPASTALERIAVARAQYFEGKQRLETANEAHSGGASTQAAPPLSTQSAAQHAAYWWNMAADEAERIGRKGEARQYRSQSKQYLSR